MKKNLLSQHRKLIRILLSSPFSSPFALLSEQLNQGGREVGQWEVRFAKIVVLPPTAQPPPVDGSRWACNVWCVQQQFLMRRNRRNHSPLSALSPSLISALFLRITLTGNDCLHSLLPRTSLLPQVAW